MSSDMNAPLSERYNQLKMLGWSLEQDQVPVPAVNQPHVVAIQQGDDDLTVWEDGKPETWMMAKQGAYIDVEAVR